MLYVHENNILKKIRENYNGKCHEMEIFYNHHYIPMRAAVTSLSFDEDAYDSFSTAADIFNEYSTQVEEFSKENRISAQSKFASTFLEEISCYLFKDLIEIKSNTFGVFNRGIYAGLKIDNHHHIDVIKKDVDFCIGKKVSITIDEQPPIELILPIVAVEVKTYLDATMFGEVKSSSKSIRSASPNSKTFVLMGYKCISDEHIIAARQDSALTEMFALKENEDSQILASVLRQYWISVKDAVDSVSIADQVPKSGRLLNP